MDNRFDFFKLIISAKKSIKNAQNINELELIRIHYFGKNGIIKTCISNLSKLPLEDRPKFGMHINKTKDAIKIYLKKRFNELNKHSIITAMDKKFDISLPGRRSEIGSLHPVSITIANIKKFFFQLGFTTDYGPEIEDKYHNFDYLNIPKHHPARHSHDTFWLNDILLLRTQTSGVQIRVMEVKKPPIRVIAPGRVYRNDCDHFHTPMFHQIEGLLIDKYINFGNLKYILQEFLFFLLGKEIKIRFRPSYFPFTQPSAELDVMNKYDEWIEVIGCGMVHPNVLRNVDIDPELYSGFAFGIGIERLVMLQYNINDLRILFENDIRFLEQFKQA
uniref:Phenylalanine--tRNA ligase alpha subunit n=1 Tax=Candidatus Aschnera chinzeii TaxID=1485666 RepID=A0AAT9G4U6_9ENTR|nr:MAG: phenylalanine--tRNA ligase subunit alpha [Candidatus Aschnera chinzeii]